MMETKSEHMMTELGEIPIDWEISDFFNNIEKTFDYRGRTPKKIGMEWGNGSIPALSANNVKNGYIDFEAECYLASEELYNKWMTNGDLRKNDVLFTMEAPLGNVTLLPDNKKYILSQRVVAFRTNDRLNPMYFNYYIDSNKFRKKLDAYSTGTTAKGISQKNLSKLKVIIPPLKEQQKIAEILSTVDEQIEQTDQLIEKTKELKKGLMQQLLTKGIGHTDFKQSELGKIPVEWDIALFEDIMLSKGEGIRRGPFGGALKKEIFVEEGYAVYEQQHAIHKEINKFRYFVTPEKYDEMAAFNVKAGDILMSCSGTIGRVLLVPEYAPEGIINQALLRLRPKSYINLQFLKYLLQSEFVQNNILDRAHGSALKNMVAVSELKKIKLRIPQEEEQKKIASILTSVDEDIEGYEEEKAKYEEFKKGLMQQLLTGKTRVKVD